MIRFEKALKTVLSYSKPLKKKTLKLDKLSSFVISKPLISKYDIPLFDNSAVDGFGVRIEDIKNLPQVLQLQGTVRAGDSGNIKLKKGFTIKILTGAPIPKGVNAMVMKEFCDEEKNHITIKRKVSYGENIRRRGEEFKAGKTVLQAGIYVTPPVLGLIASLGYSSFEVYEKPKISVIVTGSELVKPGQKLFKGKIYESNSYAISSALQEIGINNFKIIATSDNKSTIKKHIAKVLKESDLIITVGGISVGDYDFVKEVLSELGVKTLFKQVAMKPAKPNYFGIFQATHNKKKKLVFGLPGNPVSALISFHEFIKPCLLKMTGVNYVSPFHSHAVLQRGLKKKAGRLEFVRGVATQKNGNLLAMPTFGQGSHMLSGIAKANCLIHFPKEKEVLKKGEKVTVEFLRWSN